MEAEKYREWMLISQYEPLPPEEAAELEAHLAAHPASRAYQEEMRAVMRGLDAWKPVEAPLDADAVLAAAHAQPSVVRALPRPRNGLFSLWRRSLAAAAGLVLCALVWSQGILIEVGGRPILAFNAPAPASSAPDLDLLRAQVVEIVHQEFDRSLNPSLEKFASAVNSAITNYQSQNSLALADLRNIFNQRLQNLESRSMSTFATLPSPGVPPNSGFIEVNDFRMQ